MRFGLTAIIVFISFLGWAQTGPGGVGATNGATTLRAWWRGDAGVTITSGAISSWADQSGYGNALIQGTAGNRPTSVISSALNNRSIVRYNATNSQFFTAPTLTGPGVDNITLFLVANGTTYQSLMRFQGTGGVFVVYPWEGTAGRPFIVSTDGGTGGGVTSGLVNSVNNIGVARYRRNTTNGMQTYLNGTVVAQKNSANLTLPAEPFYSGRYALGSEYPTADVGEMIVYYSALNDAQMVIVQNYLAAKYDAALSANDVYTMDNSGNGNYDYDVAGIGRTNASNLHNDSQGTGFVRILNPSDLEDGEFMMWGHENSGAASTNRADIPAGIVSRFARTWRVSETGGDSDVGSVDVHIDVTGLVDFATLSPCDAAASLRLLVDTDNDGLFADQTPISGATSVGTNIYRFTNVTALANNTRFTFALVNTSVSGPGGVGGTNGATELVLWLDANKNVTTSGSEVVSWSDQSGTNRVATAPATGNRPAYLTNTLNGFPVVSFGGVDDYLELNSNINTITPTMFTVMNKSSVGSGYITFLTLQNNLWLARAPSANQWGMYNNVDVLSGITLNTTYRVLSAIERAVNNVDLVSSGTLTTVTNGTALHGKAVGTIAANNGGTSGSGIQFLHGNMAELIVYTTNLNLAQRILVENALAAKYGLTLNVSIDVYTMDNPANGNFDYDVAGIARADAANSHPDARGPGIVRMYDPSNLGDNEALIWGHNNVPLTSASTDVPSGVQSRLARQWAVNEVGDVGSITVQFDLTGFYGSVTPSDLRLLVDHDNDGIYNEAGTLSISGATAISCNNYVFTGVTALSNNVRFTLGTINFTQTPLPIELVDFKGKVNGDHILLTWTTESELNNDYFTVERLVNGNTFIPVGTIAGAGTSTTSINYEFKDHFNFSADQYYRLKQTDFDGTTSYSKVIRVAVEENELISVFPNPVRIGDEISIHIPENDIQEYQNTVVLYDMFGRVITTEVSQKQADQLSVKTSGSIVPGMYILKVNLSGKTVVRRMSFVH